ncbi:MAG: hypothetical protein V3V10_05640 [Planctomycetota bacterium]
MRLGTIYGIEMLADAWGIGIFGLDIYKGGEATPDHDVSRQCSANDSDNWALRLRHLETVAQGAA